MNQESIKQKQAFTLIELLVVIAIIAMLSSVILAALGSARTKGNDGVIKEDLVNAQTQASIVYTNNNGTYANVCSDANILSAMQAASSAGAGNTTSWVCNTSGGISPSAYAIFSPLKSSGYWCVDSIGNSRAEASAPGGASACP